MNPAKPSAAALDRAQQRVLAALCHEHADSRKPVRTQMLCIACNAASAEKMEGVMLALTALKRAGLVERREGGSWLPTREGRAQAASAPPAAPKPASPAPARVAAAPATPLAPPPARAGGHRPGAAGCPQRRDGADPGGAGEPPAGERAGAPRTAVAGGDRGASARRARAGE